MRQLDRLGLAADADSAERLAVCARLLGLGDLGSTRDLTMGQAGQLVRLLVGCAGRADLPEVTAAPVDDAEDQAGEHSGGERVTCADVITHIVAALSAAPGGIPPRVITEPDCTDSRTEGTPI
jgi:hypothetical protein